VKEHAAVRRCSWCDKKIFNTRIAARRFLRLHTRLDTRDFDAENLFAYRCPHGRGVHVGHNAAKWQARDLVQRPAWWRWWSSSVGRS
jgi:hypothetical protein